MITTLTPAALAILLSSSVTNPPNVPAPPDQCTAWTIPFWGGGITAGASWRDNSANEDGFQIEWKTSSPKNRGSLTVEPDMAGTTFAVVRSGSTVSCRVRAFNAAGNSAWSGWTTINVQ